MLIYNPNKITTLRGEKGWNQAELARRARLSQPSVWAIEHGETRMPKFETLAAIAAALGVPVQTIMADPPKGKNGEDLDHRAAATFAALHDENKSTALMVLETLLKRQRR
jgi:transcriptional regulator with XRE-family HTH domain